MMTYDSVKGENNDKAMVKFEHKGMAMKELMATNNLVTISYVESLLDDAQIDFLILDQNMSILEGSLGIIPKRVMVTDDELLTARRLLNDAGLGKELTSQ